MLFKKETLLSPPVPCKYDPGTCDVSVEAQRLVFCYGKCQSQLTGTEPLELSIALYIDVHFSVPHLDK